VRETDFGYTSALLQQGRGAGRAPDEKLRLGPTDGPGIRIGCARVSAVRWADEDTGGD